MDCWMNHSVVAFCALTLANICSFQGFWGHDQLPLPCGSVDAAYLTVREKRNLAEKVVASDTDLNFGGDIHVEPDHGSVVATSFDTLEMLTAPANACYGLSHFHTYEGAVWDPTI